MNNLQHFCSDPEHLLREWDELDALINLSEDLLQHLKVKRSLVEASIDELTRPLENTTCGNYPQPDSRAVKPKLIPRGFEYRGERFSTGDKIDIQKAVLGRLLQDYPEKAETMLSELHSIGRTRKYLARDRSALFRNKPPEWVRQYSKHIGDGWYMDTNLSESMMRRILKVAVQSAGLTWDKDVVVHWSPQWVQPDGSDGSQPN